MNPLVQIAYNTINQFALSETDKQTLIAMLQGTYEEQEKKQLKKKLKKVSQDVLDEVEILRELLNRKQLFPPKSWNGYHKGIKVF
ncbi:MAG: hypothetical protein Q3983_09955 [Capnocytophaga sp.]|nr:hypothetical protein [Capnocytophaga sp.]